MHFQSMLPAFLSLVTLFAPALVSAQTTNSTVGPECGACLVNGMKTFPACTSINVNPTVAVTDPSSLDPATKACYCALVLSTTWAQNCVSATGCPQDMITQIDQGFTAAKGVYCNGNSASGSSSSSGSGSGNAALGAGNANLVLTAMGVVVALVGVVTHVMLYL
jgi:hypothetical protein